jgi:hypothetical protein
MAFTKKTPTIKLPASLDAAAAAAGGQTAASKKYLAAPVDNSQLQLKDAQGQPLPATITGQQLVDSLNNTKYNGSQIEALKQAVAGIGRIPSNVKLSATGQITPDEIKAITGTLAEAAGTTAAGTKVNLVQHIQDVKDGTGLQSLYPDTTINLKQLDQPNIEASKATINDVFLSLLGRSASEKEIGQYTQKYLDYAAKNPTSQTSGVNKYNIIATPTASGGTSNRLFRGSQNETGIQNNLTEQAFLQNQVKSTGEYNAFTAAGTGFDMLTKMAQKDVGAM